MPESGALRVAGDDIEALAEDQREEVYRWARLHGLNPPDGDPKIRSVTVEGGVLYVEEFDHAWWSEDVDPYSVMSHTRLVRQQAPFPSDIATQILNWQDRRRAMSARA